MRAMKSISASDGGSSQTLVKCDSNSQGRLNENDLLLAFLQDTSAK